MDPAAVSKNTKTCPLCRTKSDFVIPSSVFPTPPTVDAKSDRENSGPSQAPDNEAAEEKQNPVKEQIIQGYLAKLKKIPCRYFEDEVKRWREKVARAEARNGGSASSTRPPKFVPKCSFANKCHYAHLDPITKEPYVFSASEIRDMKRRRHEQRARELRDRWFNNIPPGPHLEFVTRSFEEISFDPCPGSPDEQDFHFALAVATLDRELFSYTLPAVDSDHDDDYGDYYYEDYGYGGISEPESPRERPTEWLPDWEHERRYGWGVLEDAYL